MGGRGSAAPGQGRDRLQPAVPPSRLKDDRIGRSGAIRGEANSTDAIMRARRRLSVSRGGVIGEKSKARSRARVSPGAAAPSGLGRAAPPTGTARVYARRAGDTHRLSRDRSAPPKKCTRGPGAAWSSPRRPCSTTPEAADRGLGLRPPVGEIWALFAESLFAAPAPDPAGRAGARVF
jgi:hypothetical protein